VFLFWLQSLVRDNGQRALLFDMDLAIQDLAIQRLGAQNPTDASAIQLTGVDHDLLRMWSDI